ncbi:hypothetical protein CEE37_14455 [candidate division LCP-89 bacterium B3_LCP]|uniref:ABC transporter domain-containing protein n=1 Tax=candidate division LCP-89 bacterium B3_LCP TaxID=2012998 RepID=A0A532UPS1_UNCL8|nr:MAG: hypothetical protein CEE37_14455 [candidate division LCP-89 bacterium B3_LCP]
MNQDLLLSVTNLHIHAPEADEAILKNIALYLEPGKMVSIVGESGSGKTTLLKCLLGVLDDNVVPIAGHLKFSRNDSFDFGRFNRSWWSKRRFELFARRKRRFLAMFQNTIDFFNHFQTLQEIIAPKLSRVKEQNSPWGIVRNHDGPEQRTLDWLTQFELTKISKRVNAARITELSGGNIQRFALADLSTLLLPYKDGSFPIIALDEPISDLDKKGIETFKTFLRNLSKAGATVIYVGHNLKIIEEFSDFIGIMYLGRIVQWGPKADFFGENSMRHAYTEILFDAWHKRDIAVKNIGNGKGLKERSHLPTIPGPPLEKHTLKGCGLCERIKPRPGHEDCVMKGELPSGELMDHYRICDRHFSDMQSKDSDQRYSIQVVDQPLLQVRIEAVWPYRYCTFSNPIDFEMKKGENLGVQGENGCGKTSLLKALLGLRTYRGSALADQGGHLTDLTLIDHRQWITRCQYIFQNCSGSLNPSLRLNHQYKELFQLYNDIYGLSYAFEEREVTEGLHELLFKLNLGENILQKFPYKLSGGQKKRAFILQTFITLGLLHEWSGLNIPEPEWRILMIDEVTEGLDILVENGLLSLLYEIQARTRMSYIIVSHRESMIALLCDRILKLYPDERNHDLHKSKVVAVKDWLGQSSPESPEATCH